MTPTELSPLAQVTDRAVAELQKLLGVLENHLMLRTYLVGEAVTLADVTVACSLLLPYKYVSLLALPSHSHHPDFCKDVFFLSVVSRPHFQSFIFLRGVLQVPETGHVFCF